MNTKIEYKLLVHGSSRQGAKRIPRHGITYKGLRLEPSSFTSWLNRDEAQELFHVLLTDFRNDPRDIQVECPF